MIIFMITMKASGTEQLAYGLLAGTTTSLFIGLFILSRRVFGHWRMAAWAQVRDLVVLSPFTMVATSCFSIYAVIDSYWATRAGDGVLASLGYSQRITIAIGNLAVVAPSAILVPKFSALVSKGIGDEFDKMLKKTLAITSAIGFTLAVGIYIGAVPLIELLFMRGAFDQNDVDRVAVILQFCLPGMSFSLLSVISLRILFCFPNIEKIAALLGILWCATYFFLSSMLYHLNGKGLAIAYSLTWTIYFFIVAYFLKIKQKKFTQ
jgi:putative peptidoglycan lipid II flippase